MRGVRRFFDRIPRRLRVAVDLTLAAALLLALYVAAGCPAFGEENEFRRAEKAGMMGPSEIMDWVAVQRGWPSVGYDRVLIGDDGDAILFYTYTTGRGTSSLEGRLLRREKTEGLLLTPLPCGSVNFWQSTEVLPLFLFADDPDAVRAEVLLRLTGEETVTLTGDRRASEGDGSNLPGFFYFQLPVTGANREALESLMSCASTFADYGEDFPAVIRLYDAGDRLLTETDYVIRPRRGQQPG